MRMSPGCDRQLFTMFCFCRSPKLSRSRLVVPVAFPVVAKSGRVSEGQKVTAWGDQNSCADSLSFCTVTRNGSVRLPAQATRTPTAAHPDLPRPLLTHTWCVLELNRTPLLLQFLLSFQLSPRRVRLHHVHWQLGPSGGASKRRHREGRARHVRRAVREQVRAHPGSRSCASRVEVTCHAGGSRFTLVASGSRVIKTQFVTLLLSNRLKHMIHLWTWSDTINVDDNCRNFEGRIHPLTRANYLASPLLVVAYAIAGTVLIDFETEPIGEQWVWHLSAEDLSSEF